MSLQSLSLHSSARPQPPACNPSPFPATSHSLLHVPLFPSPPPVTTASATVVVWFRSDLRLHDHPALTHALEEAGGGSVLPVFIFDPRSFGKTRFGFEKTGRYRAKFIVESVSALRQSLRDRGSDLIIRIGQPEQVLPSLCRAAGARVLMCHHEVNVDDHHIETQLKSALGQSGVEMHPMWTNTLYHIEDLPFPLHSMPDVYTQFRESVQRHAVQRDPLPAPSQLPAPPRVQPGDVPTLKDFGLSEPPADLNGMHTFQGGEEEALRRLDLFVQGSTNLPAERRVANHLGADFSCRIAPWLALGCVSPRRIYSQLKEGAGKAGTNATYFELVWRDFFKYISAKYSRAKVANARKTSSAAYVRDVAMAAH